MRNKRLFISLIIGVLLLTGIYLYLDSVGYFEEQTNNQDINWSKAQSTSLGKELAIQEELDIKIFLEAHKDWDMIRTGSGLRYEILEHGEGDSIRAGDRAEIEYEIKQLSGELCSRTESDEYEEFDVDKSEIESGIQEGIKYLKVGDRARFIIPSHLAHGLVGNMDNVPPLTTLWVEINVLGKVDR